MADRTFRFLLISKLALFLMLVLRPAPAALSDSEDFSERLKTLRDPLRMPIGIEQISEVEDLFKRLPFTIEIKGVVIDKDKKYVIINDKLVKEKEIWQDLTIDEITKDYLTVIYGERKIQISLKKGSK